MVSERENGQEKGKKKMRRQEVEAKWKEQAENDDKRRQPAVIIVQLE